MKLIITALVLILTITACATPSAYRPASGSGYGYSESRISNERYRVVYEARGDNRGEAMDYAMLRAAELTMQKGFDWFEVVDRQTEVVREKSDPDFGFGASTQTTTTRSCGLLGCSTTTRPTYGSSAAISTGVDRERIVSMIEIRMGRGIRPSTRSTYDAREVAGNLRAQRIN